MMDYCETCVYYPPSSCDGKPCTQCDITNPFLTCYREKEFVVDFYQEHKPINADRIRSMTNEELANVFTMISDCISCNCRNAEDDCSIVDGTCQQQWLKWLQQEV